MVKSLLRKLGQYPRLRILLMLAGIFFVLWVVFHLFSSDTQAPVTGPNSQIQAPQNLTHVKREVGQAEYNKLLKEKREAALKAAEVKGHDYFNNIFDGQRELPPKKAVPKITTTPVNPIDFNRHQKQIQARSVAEEPQPTYTANTTDQNQQAIDETIQRMREQLNQIGNTANANATPRLTTVSAPVAAPTSSTSSANTQGPVIIKAGTILYAVINTAVDSDQTGTPVLATIVANPTNPHEQLSGTTSLNFIGSKLIGSFTLEGDALVVKFNSLTMTEYPDSIGVTAYAINAQTAQTFLASTVNNHYLERYGSLFAAAFLQGFGQAYQNTQYQCSPGSLFCVVNTPPNNDVNFKNSMFQGLGKVGETLGTNIGDVFNTPPTVTLKQGTAVGILFTSDVTLGSPVHSPISTPTSTSDLSPSSDTTSSIRQSISNTASNAVSAIGQFAASRTTQ